MGWENSSAMQYSTALYCNCAKVTYMFLNKHVCVIITLICPCVYDQGPKFNGEVMFFQGHWRYFYLHFTDGDISILTNYWPNSINSLLKCHVDIGWGHKYMPRNIQTLKSYFLNCFLIILTHFVYKTGNNRDCYMEMVATNNKNECVLST